uniref:Uncharacterized protein n=1 Tax=Cyanothece sp. (strain PCC 7425 / ATCC 29141) TaxID=395961 RepID=B8HU99_CYAP4
MGHFGFIRQLSTSLDRLDPGLGSGERREWAFALKRQGRSSGLFFAGLWIALTPIFPPVRPPLTGGYQQQMQYWRWQQQQQINQQIQQFDQRQQQQIQQLQQFQQQQQLQRQQLQRQQQQTADQQRQQLERLQDQMGD